MKTSSVSRATTASTSADSYALTNFADERLLAGESAAGARAVGRRLAALQTGARPLERAVHRFDGRVEHVGDLARAESEHVAQDQDGDLARRQELQGRHEASEMDSVCS